MKQQYLFDELKQTSGRRLKVAPKSEPVRGTEKAYYVGSKNSNIYHRPDCKWAKKINRENLLEFGVREKPKGYKHCSDCK